MRTPPRGRSTSQLLAHFGYDLPTKPEPSRPGNEPYLFRSSPRHGQRGPGLCVRAPKQPTTTCSSRHAIVVTGAGSGTGKANSMTRSPAPPWTGATESPFARRLQVSATGSQRYSSSVRPSRRGRSWLVAARGRGGRPGRPKYTWRVRTARHDGRGGRAHRPARAVVPAPAPAATRVQAQADHAR